MGFWIWFQLMQRKGQKSSKLNPKRHRKLMSFRCLLDLILKTFSWIFNFYQNVSKSKHYAKGSKTNVRIKEFYVKNKIWHNKNIRFLPFRVLILVIRRSFFHDWDDSNCCLYFTQKCHVHCFTPVLNLNFCQKKLEWKLAQYRIGQVKLAAAAVLYDSIWIQPLIFSFDYEIWIMFCINL